MNIEDIDDTPKRSTRKDRSERRGLNTDEVEGMGYVQMNEAADEEGWPYPDEDDPETTEYHAERRAGALVYYQMDGRERRPKRKRR